MDFVIAVGVVALFALIFGLVSALLVWSERRYRTQGVAVMAQVVDFEVRRSSSTSGSGGSSRRTYHPVVAYRTAEGLDVRGRSPMGSSHPRLSVGQAVELHYLPQNPERFRIRGDGSMVMAAVFGAIALLCLGIAAALAVSGLL